MKQVSIFLALVAYFFATITANGNSPGNCLKDGTLLWEGPGGPSSYTDPRYMCKSGYGRPLGVCNCVRSLNSCNQLLAGCPASRNATFTTPIPPTIYVGQYYEFITDIRVIGGLPCLSRNLPAGLVLTAVEQDGFNVTAITGTPTESVPKVEYGLAVGPRGVGSESVFFSFEVQSCAEGDVYIPTPAPTTKPSTTSTSTPASSTPSSSPTTTPTTDLPSSCSTEQQGFMRCSASSQYQTCNRGSWGPVQSCSTGLVCYPRGDFVYCDRPGSTPL